MTKESHADTTKIESGSENPGGEREMSRIIAVLIGLIVLASCSTEVRAPATVTETVVSTVTETKAPVTETESTTVTSTVTAAAAPANSSAESSDVSMCKDAYGRFNNETRVSLDAAILKGSLSPVDMWFAASSFGAMHVGERNGEVAKAIGDFNGSAMLLVAGGIVDMGDEEAQNFMQDYYNMRETCKQIGGWK